jgi:DNA gyrase subunit A
MRLQRLTGLEREKIVAEYHEIVTTIRDLRDILARPERVSAIIRDELAAVKAAYGNPRRTEIVAASADLELEDLIVEEAVVLTVTRDGYAKRTSLSTYREQKRGGKGRTGAATKEEDVVEQLFVASTHDHLLVFTNQGRVHGLKVHRVPEAGPASRGKALVNLLELAEGERVAALTTTRDLSEDRFLLFATRNGRVKRTVLSAYANLRSSGLIAINLEEGDELLSVHITDGDRDVFLGTRDGMAIKFSESDVRPMGRDTTGVKGIELREGDVVVEMDPVEESGTLLTVTENGFGKRTDVAEYRHQTRGGTGVINVKVTEKNGPVAGIRSIVDSDQLLLITQQGIVIRLAASEVRKTGRATMGVRLIDLEGGDRVVAVAKLAEKDEENGEETPRNGAETGETGPATDSGENG